MLKIIGSFWVSFAVLYLAQLWGLGMGLDHQVALKILFWSTGVGLLWDTRRVWFRLVNGVQDFFFSKVRQTQKVMHSTLMWLRSQQPLAEVISFPIAIFIVIMQIIMATLSNVFILLPLTALIVIADIARYLLDGRYVVGLVMVIWVLLLRPRRIMAKIALGISIYLLFMLSIARVSYGERAIEEIAMWAFVFLAISVALEVIEYITARHLRHAK